MVGLQDLGRLGAVSGLGEQVLGHEGDSSGMTILLESTYDDFKRWIDFPVAALLLTLFSPIMVISLILVKLTSRGPALYTQRRVGRGGCTFTIYKIRTMVQDSEPNGPRWSLPGDPRVTTIGRFLRWSHLDELPQLANVLKGEMSLIGPRPERPEIVHQLERVLPGYRRRLITRPGLSGLAQVLNPPDSDLRSVRIKLSYDLYYISHLGLELDARIAIATLFHLANVPRRWISRWFGFPTVDPDAIEASSAPAPVCGGVWDADADPFSLAEARTSGQLEPASTVS
jgi:lipopolysaccharide/colanic/teichoic acid biosynthesis glycosyltransferase